MPRTVFPDSDSHLLPDKLTPGLLLAGPSGLRARVIVTDKRGHFDEPLYRLHYLARRDPGGWQLPEMDGYTLYSRDQLNLEMKMEE